MYLQDHKDITVMLTCIPAPQSREQTDHSDQEPEPEPGSQTSMRRRGTWTQGINRGRGACK